LHIVSLSLAVAGLLTSGFGSNACGALEHQTRPSAKPQRVVIPFDFQSSFDQGEYGQKIGELVWEKLRHSGAFVVPESMQDVRDWCQRNRTNPGPDTTLAKMRQIVREEQGGDIGIWGRIERAAGFKADVYDLWIAIADFSVEPPRMIYRQQARTQNVSEIPHRYIKEALGRLIGRSGHDAPTSSRTPAPDSENGPNLVNGTFELGRSAPIGWDRLGPGVSWVVERGKPQNHVVRFTLSEDVAGTSGVLLYSAFFPVQPGATYRFHCRWRSTGCAAKVFIKCYDEFAPADGAAPAARATTERREVYRSQQNLTGPVNSWNTHTEDFTPRHDPFTPRWGRVMLYAYWPAGSVEWDDICIKQIKREAPPQVSPQP
jgi:hypothetical protein